MKHTSVVLITLAAAALLAAGFTLTSCRTAQNPKRAIVFDTDVGTDDAMVFLLLKKCAEFKPDYIIATYGNTSYENAVINSSLLCRRLGLESRIVHGVKPDESVDLEEKNDFHGSDGLANISAEMKEKLGVTDAELASALDIEAFTSEILAYDEIVYICTGPTATLAALTDNTDFTSRLSEVYIMGGGIHEFNCSHDTEFNFSKDPAGAAKLLSAGLDITLFPLDLTNHQTQNAAEIDSLAEYGTFDEFITFMRYNLSANANYNGGSGAVIHDMMPMLAFISPSDFTIKEMKLSIDEYGHLYEDEKSGHAVKVAISAREGLLRETLEAMFAEE